VGYDADLQPLLDHLAHTLVRHEAAQRALMAAAEQVAGAADRSAATLATLRRLEMFERRARLHVEIARGAIARRRAAHLDDLRRVPAAFRRVPARGGKAAPPSPPSVSVMGTRVPRAVAPPVAARDRAAS